MQSTATPTPPPLCVDTHALFLDFDGTLVEFAQHPDAVEVSQAVRACLQSLSRHLNGALALVSGRRIDALDSLLQPLKLPAAGLHGLECRIPPAGARWQVPLVTARLDELLDKLNQFAAARPGLLVENKQVACALHYRGAPQYAAEAADFIAGLETLIKPEFQIQQGHEVLEIRPVGADKGNSIETFMQQQPFCDRCPVFVGDDRTDEPGFAVVNNLGGISIKVGCGETNAMYRLPDPGAVRAWLSVAA